jgi:hypothetical protein
MIDPLVERRYSDCRELLQLWRRYHDFFKLAVAGDGVLPEKEHEFITIKSRIAMVHDTFMDCLDRDQNIGQNVLSIVTRSITLKHLHRMSTAEIKKIELEWHESYLLLNEVIGILDDKRRQFANVSPSQYYRQFYTKKTIATIRNFVTGWVFKTIVVLVVLMVGAFAALQFGLVDQMFKWGPTHNIVVKFEDLIRMVVSDYPYRDLSSLKRLDGNITPQDIQQRPIDQTQRAYNADAGIAQVARKMSGNPNDFSNDLKPQIECRTEAYTPALGSALGGVECVVWLFRMPGKQAAVLIEGKYNTWATQLSAGARPDWVFFRKGNVIGIGVGGDVDGRIRNWARDQYLRIRRK